MKANEVPEKVYFSSTEDGTHYYTEGIPSEREYVEYVRKDAFIEKALEWICKEIRPYYSDVKYKYEDFKKYLKGE